MFQSKHFLFPCFSVDVIIFLHQELSLGSYYITEGTVEKQSQTVQFVPLEQKRGRSEAMVALLSR